MEKPVSCVKLKEQYSREAAEYGCYCNFRRAKDCYPSPVMHALCNAEEVSRDITLPISRHMSIEKKEVVYDELNYSSRAEEIANNLVELKKQQKVIENAIKKAEHELTVIFDSSNINCLEIGMGILTRKWTEDGWDWMMDI